METSKRLIPYSVHLPEELHVELRELAKCRKASSLVRDALTSMLKGGKPFDSGYNQAIRDVLKLINKHDTANFISFNGKSIADDLIEDIEELSK